MHVSTAEQQADDPATHCCCLLWPFNPPAQGAINSCAKKVLTTSKLLPCWGQPEVHSFHELIAADKEVVKTILRLTGSVEGIKMQVRATTCGCCLRLMPCSSSDFVIGPPALLQLR